MGQLGIDYYHLENSDYKCIVFYFGGLRWKHWGFDTGRSSNGHSQMPLLKLLGGTLIIGAGQRITRGVPCNFEFLVSLFLGHRWVFISGFWSFRVLEWRTEGPVPIGYVVSDVFESVLLLELGDLIYWK